MKQFLIAIVSIIILLMCFDARAQAQQTGAEFPYVDLHSHISFKHYYNTIDHPDLLSSYLQNCPGIIKKANWAAFPNMERNKRRDKRGKRQIEKGKTSYFTNYNQSDYHNLSNAKAKGSIICNAFIPMEKMFTSRGFFRYTNNFFVSKMSIRRQRVVADNTNSPFNEFMAEYRFVAAQDSFANNTSIVFVKDSVELAQLHQKDSSAIAVLMTIEGGHTLAGVHNSNWQLMKDWECDDRCEQEFLDNVDVLKNLPHRLVFIGLAHFSYNKLSGHAKTFDRKGALRSIIQTITLVRRVKRLLFLKHGEGLNGELDCGKQIKIEDCGCRNKLLDSEPSCSTSIGSKVVWKLLTPDGRHQKPVYIDIKHMDMQAREDYYVLRDSFLRVNHKPQDYIPIIVSHGAPSGEPWRVAKPSGLEPLFDKHGELRNPKEFYEKQAGRDSCWHHFTEHRYHLKPGQGYNPFDTIWNIRKAGWFYPWSINLADEEIVRVHKSGGIIGLMMDGRQLGQGMKNYNKEYTREIKKNFKTIMGKKNNTTLKFEEYCEIEPFIRSLFYLITHCDTASTDSAPVVCWNHVGIGTDFDGLIDPLDVCPIADSLPGFRKKLIKSMDIYRQIHPGRHSWEDFSQIWNGRSTEALVRQLFYENGEAFVRKYF